MNDHEWDKLQCVLRVEIANTIHNRLADHSISYYRRLSLDLNYYYYFFADESSYQVAKFLF